MEITWLIFVPALVILFYPLDAWLNGRLLLREYEWLRNDPLLAKRTWWKHHSLWVDPVRAFIGAWGLHACWTVDELLPTTWRLAPIAVKFLILAGALFVQMHTRHSQGAWFAPVGYAAGLVCGVLPLQVAVLIVASGAVCLMAFRNWSAFFLCGAMAAAGFGYMILKVNVWVAGTVALLAWPVAVSQITQRPLMFPMTSKRSMKRDQPQTPETLEAEQPRPAPQLKAEV